MESPPPNEWFKQIENIQPAKEHKEHKEQYNHSVIEKHTSWMVYLAKPPKKIWLLVMRFAAFIPTFVPSQKNWICELLQYFSNPNPKR